MLGLKILLPLGAGLAGLLFYGGKANAKTPAPAVPGGGAAVQLPAGTSKLTLPQVVEKMSAAINTADPAVIGALADALERQGFPDQARDLRGVANALRKVGAEAAGTVSPPQPPKPATPIAGIPQAKPSDPVALPQPKPSPAAPEQRIELPNETIFGTPPKTSGTASTKLAASVALDQQVKPKWKDNRDLVATFQLQESALGHYVSIMSGNPAKVDGLYGPSTAILLAKFYGMVPPNPKYWDKNPQPAVTKYRGELLKLAAADPARAEEWNQAAQKVRAT